MAARPIWVYSGVAFIYLLPLPFQALTHVIQVSNDASWQMWCFWWGKESLSHGLSPYYTDRLLYPLGASLYLSPTDMVSTLLSIPLQYLIGLVPAYNVLVFGSLVFSAWAMRRLALEVTGSHEGALVAGAAFAFMPLVSVFVNMGHLMWVNVGFMPLAVLSLIRLEEGRLWAVVPRAIPLCLALLVSPYQVLFLLVFTFLYASYRWAVMAFERDWKRLGRFCLRITLWGTLGTAFVVPILIPTLREGRANTLAQARLDWVAGLSAGMLDPFRPNPLNPLFGGVGEDGRSEVSAFGYVLLALAITGTLRARKRAGFWLLAFLAFYLLSLGPIPRIGSYRLDWPFLPYNLLYRLPFGKIPRTPVRFLFPANLCLAVLVAWGVAYVTERTERTPRPWPRWSVPVIVVLLLIEFWPGLRPMDLMSINPFYDRLARSAPGAVLELPRPLIARAMFWQTVHGHPILGGYFARYPPQSLRNWSVPVVRQLWRGDQVGMEEFWQKDVLGQRPLIRNAPEVLDAYGVRYVVLHRNEPDSALLEVALRQALPTASVFWEDSSLRAYRIPEYPRRGGVIVGFGLGWERPRQQPPDPDLLHAAGKESELGLVLLDSHARAAELDALVLLRRPGPIAMELNATPVASLPPAPARQTLSVQLLLRPGYNSLRFRALAAGPPGPTLALPSQRAFPSLMRGDEPDLLYIGRVKVRTDPPGQPGAGLP